MKTFISMLVVGIVMIAIGISNMMGNISSLHSYHRKRVKEADRRPFGRLVGIGTILVGLSVIWYGVSLLLVEKTQNEGWVLGGVAGLSVGICVGLGISFFAMYKYNKGVF